MTGQSVLHHLELVLHETDCLHCDGTHCKEIGVLRHVATLKICPGLKEGIEPLTHFTCIFGGARGRSFEDEP